MKRNITSITALKRGYTSLNKVYRGTNTVWESGDADAEAFITAAEITNDGQKAAITNLVTGLKSDGLWTKLDVIYPMVGGTANAHKYNLKDPRDLDVAYRLSFNGGWTHSSTGAKPNGTDAWADTFIVPSTFGYTSTSGGFMGYYSGTQITTSDANVEIGAWNTAGGANGVHTLSIRYNASLGTFRSLNGTQVGGQIYDNKTNGWWTVTRTGSTLETNRDNTLLFTDTNAYTGLISNLSITLATGNRPTGPAADYSDKECRFAVFAATTLSTGDRTNLYNRIQEFQSILLRPVNP